MEFSDILDECVSHALTLGIFKSVNTFEPKSPVENGLVAAMWIESIAPYAAGSGLASTSARVAFRMRIYSNMLQKPEDEIDPRISEAVDILMGQYSGDFDLGGSVRCVDLLGMAGVPLGAQAGYINMSNTMYRVMDITLPLIVDDAWTQGA